MPVQRQSSLQCPSETPFGHYGGEKAEPAIGKMCELVSGHESHANGCPRRRPSLVNMNIAYHLQLHGVCPQSEIG